MKCLLGLNDVNSVMIYTWSLNRTQQFFGNNNRTTLHKIINFTGFKAKNILDKLLKLLDSSLSIKVTPGRFILFISFQTIYL